MRKLLLACSCLFTTSLVYGQHLIITNNLKKQYTPKAVIAFEITPQKTDTLYLSIGLEILTHKGWTEITNDISKPSFGSKRIEVLRLVKMEKVKCDLNKLALFDKRQSLKGTYRFAYNIGYSISQLDDNAMKDYSSGFIIQ
jgi:hypothetical protein